jgi:hypothetical protein
LLFAGIDMLGELVTPAPTLAPVEATLEGIGVGLDVTAPTTAAAVAPTPPRSADVSAPALTPLPPPPDHPLLDDEAEFPAPPAIDWPAEATPDDELLPATPAPTLLPTELMLED